MYLIIGLKRNGKLSLANATEDRPPTADLEELVKDFEYTQLLVVESSGCQEARFEVHASPLWQVGLA